MKTQFIYLFLALAVTFSQSCDSINELSGGADAPEVTYASTTFEADFYQAGNSSVPSIDWNGAQGSVSLGSSVEGLSVNSTTGQLQWTKMLPVGTHEVEVVIANSEGQVVVPLTVENLPAGTFTGTDSRGFYWSITFMKDGTATVLLNSKNAPDPATATYELTGIDLEGTVTYDDASSVFAITGRFMLSSSKAVFDGEWYNGMRIDPGNVGATFALELE
ncbi:hypothetical protein [Lewinella sp. IMCC34183]|uniref:hypothetical protein n=1 Tax=Lewinella sp. IMCC34183 TaxID=2248762 RepID=UPI000E25CED4|nr:hypothetical protein [Lewinella sp. IMCC34183]